MKLVVEFPHLGELDRAFAAATKLVRAHARLSLVFAVGRDAARPLMGHALRSWLERRAPELRARVESIVIEMPSWPSVLGMKLEVFAARPPIPIRVRRATMAPCSSVAGPPR